MLAGLAEAEIVQAASADRAVAGIGRAEPVALVGRVVLVG
jgi:hypothetical protein